MNHPSLRQPSELTVEVVRSLERIAELEGDFAHLQAVTGNTLPFALFEWQLVWCRHFRRQHPAIADEPLLHVARNREGHCVAIVPLIRTRRRMGMFNIVSLGLLGADPAITEIRTCLVAPGFAAAVADALSVILPQDGDWDFIQWAGMRDEFCTALGRLRGLEWVPGPPSYVLDLPPAWDTFRAGLKRNIRESLRHCYNSLKRDGHAFVLNVATTPAGVRSALERLFVLHTLRAAMPGSVPHPDHFASAAVRRFLHEVCGELAVRDRVRVFELEIAGRVVASRIGFVVGDGLYLYYSGYDPEWGKYGVMTTTVAEAIKYSIARGLKTVNLSTGYDVSKIRWSPREVAHQVAYEHGRRVRSRLVRHVYVKARSGAGLEGWLLHRLIPGQRHWS
ncbi:MAG TPA: GNAT family N-acetyltransferase [Steroidobacteraceae bacterium]|nr:GNAT family N-acetyltransferase [Steroidobacteraceae bacterium]